ncbi:MULTISPECIES: hypothetical protein [unclassified Chryseobacterium]|uniref:hypothetical protein n=1 Tax=unclassified Chryseobacterium TaxID=2593645 RepID=UPI00226A4176|nr:MULTISPECIES: hypothetical protein [unclassified Chryseobacterium]
MTELNAKPINFKFGEYLSNGFEFLKNNFGNLLLAVIFCFIMAFIPLCGMLGMGNLYKYCRKLRKGQNTGPGEIFNFDDFMPYLMLQLIIFGGMLLLFIPLFFITLLTRIGGDDSAVGPVMVVVCMIVFYIALFYVIFRGFYIPALISLGEVKDIKKAWNMSKVMTKGNFWSILGFAIVVGILSQLGILACGIGILFTLPLNYTANYFAFEDAMQQIEHDEIKEIGVKNEY